MSSSEQQQPVVRVGCLALQGSFREHMALLRRIPGVDVVEVRTCEELAGVSGLIIPGGESTTMALVAERWGLIPELRAFAASGKPIWGTCAGLIFLAERAEGKQLTRGWWPLEARCAAVLVSPHLLLFLLRLLNCRHEGRGTSTAGRAGCHGVSELLWGTGACVAPASAVFA